MLKGFQFKFICGISLFLLASANFAVTPVLPGSVQPGPLSRAISSQRPVASSSVTAPTTAPQPQIPAKLLEQARKIKFKLNAIILEGNQVYSTSQLEPIYAKYLHRTISVADLFIITQEITNFYRNNGYILSRALLPPQKVTSGAVRIRIIEGYIGNVSVIGHPHGAACLVQRYGNKIKACPPLQLTRMEKYLLLANEIPGTQVKALLSPSNVGTGAADLTLDAENQPVTSYFSYDNYGTRYIGPQEMTGNLGLNSMAVSGDTTQITFTKTPKGGELTYTDINYSLPVNDEGMRLLVGGTRTHTHPLFILRPAQIDSLYDNYYTSLNYPVIRTRSDTLNLRTTFNYADVQTTTLDEPLYTDHLRTIGFGLTYNFADKWHGTNLIMGDLRQGLPILGYTKDTGINAITSHPGGSGNYTKIVLLANRLQAIKGPLSFYGEVTGQWARDALLATEQFTFGGPQLGRGYDVGELIGDKGFAGTLEARFDGSFSDFILRTYQLYAFYDAGEIWNLRATGGLPKKLSGTSTGVGMRFSFLKSISGNVMWTQTLTKQVAAEEFIGEGHRPRVFFSVVANID